MKSMKWAYSIKNKAVASIALLGLCALVLFSNQIDRDHTEDVTKSISTLYEDRLIAESYIFQMMSALYQIKEQMVSDTATINKNERINALLLDFEKTSQAYLKTKFTAQEKIKADELLLVLQDLQPSKVTNPNEKLDDVNQAIALLNDLSGIQLAESKQIMNHAERLSKTGKASSQFVFALIIVILLVLQALVFTSKPTITNKQIERNENE